jgi:hypothetical protein
MQEQDLARERATMRMVLAGEKTFSSVFSRILVREKVVSSPKRAPVRRRDTVMSPVESGDCGAMAAERVGRQSRVARADEKARSRTSYAGESAGTCRGIARPRCLGLHAADDASIQSVAAPAANPW